MIWRIPRDGRTLLGVLVRFVQNVMRIKTVVEHHLEAIISAQPIKANTRIGLRRVFIVVLLMIWKSPRDGRTLLGVLVRFVQNLMRIKTVVEHHLEEIISAQPIKTNTRIGLRRVFIVVLLMIWKSPRDGRTFLGVLVRFVQNVKMPLW